MKSSLNRTSIAPVKFRRSRYMRSAAGMTSLQAGRMVPVFATGLLREDGARGRLSFHVEMEETADMLSNAVLLRARAFLVPMLALERFEGSRDQFDRSFNGLAKIEGGASVGFIENAAAGTHAANLVLKYLGKHAVSTDQINTAYTESYNAIWNHCARNRSPDLALRTRLQSADLGPAFWLPNRFENIVPSFDQAVIDGEVALSVSNPDVTFTNQKPDVIKSGVNTWGIMRKATDGTVETVNASVATNSGTGRVGVSGGANAFYDPNGTLEVDLAAVVGQVAESGFTVLLSNLQQARAAQTFAKLREKYVGHTDDWIIDQLMMGIKVGDQELKQPILLADETVRFQQALRYASDSGNLAESAVSGAAVVTLDIGCPPINTGGVIMVVMEAIPDLLFERQRDPFLFLSAAGWRDEIPDALRDTLDSQKVREVLNGEIDTHHATPSGTFGYEPNNAQWARQGVEVGGKYYRPVTNTVTDTTRRSIWGLEAVNPVLGEDFYVVSEFHIKPFLDQASDPFTVRKAGGVVIDGLTQFGPVLIEALDSYDEVMAEAPAQEDQIDQTP